jgi:hypothetical protein
LTSHSALSIRKRSAATGGAPPSRWKKHLQWRIMDHQSSCITLQKDSKSFGFSHSTWGIVLLRICMYMYIIKYIKYIYIWYVYEMWYMYIPRHPLVPQKRLTP